MQYSGFFIARLESGLHARDVAEKLNRNIEYVLAVEASEFKPEPEELKLFCEIYKKDEDYLLNLQLFPYVKYLK